MNTYKVISADISAVDLELRLNQANEEGFDVLMILPPFIGDNTVRRAAKVILKINPRNFDR